MEKSSFLSLGLGATTLGECSRGELCLRHIGIDPAYGRPGNAVCKAVLQKFQCHAAAPHRFHRQPPFRPATGIGGIVQIPPILQSLQNRRYTIGRRTARNEDPLDLASGLV